MSSNQPRFNIPRPLMESRLLTPIITTEQQQRQQQHHTSVKNNRQTTRKCHGNRKLRCFKKKWIKRGLNKEEIQKLIDEYNHKKKNTNQLPNQSTTEMEVVTTTNTKETKTKSNKRKQMSTSTSSRSITQQVSKKMKKKNVSINPIPIKLKYPLPKYLTKAPNLLFQALCLQLNKKLNKKNQQRFLHNRLQLIDQQYRVNLHRNLWQSYFNLGSEQQIWSNQVYKVSKTNKHELCLEFVKHRIIELNEQFDQCTAQLLTQSQSCPSKLLPIDKLDHNLTEFVHLQQKYLSNKMNSQLNRYKDVIEEKKLYRNLSTYNLTNNQNETIDRLTQLQQTQLEVFEELLKLETQVSIEFLPKHFDHLENFIVSDHLYSPAVNDHLVTEFKQNQYRIVQEAKRIWLNIFLDTYEIQYQDFEQQYREELKKFQLICSNTSQRNGINLFQSFLTYMDYRTNRMTQEIYYEKIPVHRRKLLCHRRRCLGSNKNVVNVRPRIILDLVRYPFSTTELDHLSKGPNYIRPNQSALRPAKQRVKQVDKELNTIITKLKKYMNKSRDSGKIPPTSPLYKLYSDRLRTYLLQRYMTPLPLIDQLRARRESKIVKSIRRKLKKYKLILRETDKSGVFHIGYVTDYTRKAAIYRQETSAYEELNANPYNEIIYNVTHLINQLKTMKKITEDQRMKMVPVRDKTQLAYMYFLPKPHKKGTPLRPIINTIHAATTKISKFLDQLIRPLFDRFVRQTTIVDGIDLLEKLQNYILLGYFTPSTLFVTFDINNLYTMLPQEEALKILEEFLQEHQCNRVNGISIETIVELGRIVLQANTFVNGNKFYRQIIGGAMGSAFTLTLANIFMWKWEKQTLLAKNLSSHEIYGRYIDDGFFTYNGSEETIKKILKQANGFHPNIKLEYHIGKTLPFLDILLHNNKGQLSSSVYHKPSAEPAVLSFLSDHPRHIFRNVIQTALMRAIRYSSTFEAFNIERRAIRLKLLYNSYPSKYINDQFQRFFTKHNSSSSSSSILPLIDNEQQFFILRQKLLTQPSIKQAIVKKSAAAVDTITRIENNRQTTTPIMEVTVKRKDNNKFDNTIFIHCVHEARLEGLQRHIHEIHDSFFKNTNYENIRLVIGHRNNPNMDFELSRKRPRSSLLKDPLKKK